MLDKQRKNVYPEKISDHKAFWLLEMGTLEEDGGMHVPAMSKAELSNVVYKISVLFSHYVYVMTYSKMACYFSTLSKSTVTHSSKQVSTRVLCFFETPEAEKDM